MLVSALILLISHFSSSSSLTPPIPPPLSYFIFYTMEAEIFGWYDFLNQNEINIEKMRKEYEDNMLINKRKGSAVPKW